MEKNKFNIEMLFSEPALMGHVEPEQDYYYDSEDFNDEDDYAPTSKKSKVSQGPLITDGRNCDEMWILSTGLL